MKPSALRNVAVLGASPKPGRYSLLAVMRLKDAGHRVIPVNPAYDRVEKIDTVPDCVAAREAAEPEGLDTLSLYLAPHHLEKMTEQLVACRPKRVIFNPGTESPKVMAALENAGIPYLEACTLVLLSTGQF